MPLGPSDPLLLTFQVKQGISPSRIEVTLDHSPLQEENANANVNHLTLPLSTGMTSQRFSLLTPAPT
jgi:hypothetical protein